MIWFAESLEKILFIYPVKCHPGNPTRTGLFNRVKEVYTLAGLDIRERRMNSEPRIIIAASSKKVLEDWKQVEFKTSSGKTPEFTAFSQMYWRNLKNG